MAGVEIAKQHVKVARKNTQVKRKLEAKAQAQGKWILDQADATGTIGLIQMDQPVIQRSQEGKEHGNVVD
jgi:hypothetical protein